MIPCLADEGFHAAITDAIRARGVDIVTVQEAGLSSATDEAVLDFAGKNGRLALTHDKATLVGTAWERVRAGLPMPGVVHVPWGAALGPAIEEVLCIVECGYPDEVDGQVLYVTSA